MVALLAAPLIIDLVLLADSPEELQALLDLVSRYAKRWRLKFNTGKDTDWQMVRQ